MSTIIDHHAQSMADVSQQNETKSRCREPRAVVASHDRLLPGDRSRGKVRLLYFRPGRLESFERLESKHITESGRSKVV